MSRSNWKSIGPRVVSSEMGPGDPARGEKVPRCFACGMPTRPKFPLYPGLWGYIRLNVEVTLCGECIQDLLPARVALDPVTLEECA